MEVARQMAGYLYMGILAIVLAYGILRNIYLFNRGEYNPYPYRKGKSEQPFIIRLIINVGILIGTIVFLTSIRLLYIMTVVFICYSLCLVISTSILNYLSYKRINDQKIIFQTVMFNITVIVVSSGVWIYVTKFV